jgi:hypothetical protein
MVGAITGSQGQRITKTVEQTRFGLRSKSAGILRYINFENWQSDRKEGTAQMLYTQRFSANCPNMHALSGDGTLAERLKKMPRDFSFEVRSKAPPLVATHH